MKKIILLGVLLSSPLWAAQGTPIQETRSLKPEGAVSVKNLSGSIEVLPWSRNEVELTGTLGAGSRRLEIREHRGTLEIEVVPPLLARELSPSVLRLRVPEAASVTLESLSADLKLSDLRGELRANTVSGEVRISGTPRALRVETVSGDIRFEGRAAQTALQTISGDIEARELSGESRIQSVSGDVEVEGSAWRELSVQSVSGDLEVRINALAPKAEVLLDAVSGDIRLKLADSVQAELKATTLSGALISDAARVEIPQYGPGRSLSTVFGDGGAQLRVESQSGDLEIRRK